MTDFKAKMHQIQFRLGLRRRPRWGAYSAPPVPWLDLGGRFAAGGLGWEWGGKGGGEVEGREREGPKLLLNQGPRALLRHFHANKKNFHCMGAVYRVVQRKPHKL